MWHTNCGDRTLEGAEVLKDFSHIRDVIRGEEWIWE